jgi:hypothetical protein
MYIILCGACTNYNPQHDIAETLSDTSQVAVLTAENYPEEEEYANYFIVIADTGKSYDRLLDKMHLIQSQTGLVIDSAGRQYLPHKDLIAQPEDSEDDIYAGEYYPRRFPSTELSLEYLYMYQEQAGEKTIAIVQQSIQAVAPASFVIKSRMFTGCMH